MEDLRRQLDELDDKVDSLQAKVDALKSNVDRGMGIVIGVLAVIGLFSGEIVNWVKHLFRLP